MSEQVETEHEDSPPPADLATDVDVESADLAGLTELWRPQLDKYDAYVRATAVGKGTVIRYAKGAQRFIEWCVSEGIAPDEIPDDIFDRFEAHIAAQPNMALVTQRLLRKASRDLIASMNDELEVPENDVNANDVQPQPNVQTVQAGPAQVQVKVVGPRGQRQPRQAGYAAPQRDPFRDVLPPATANRVRVYKRDRTGKRVYLEDFSLDDIGKQPMPKFLKEFVDPQFKDPSGITQYEVFKVGADEQDIGPGYEFRIESEPVGSPDDPMSKAREALDMVQQMSERMSNHGKKETDDMLSRVAEKRAESGSMSDMMALMMMREMAGGKRGGEEETLMRVLDKLRPNAPAASMPPMMTPPAAVPSELAPVVAELIKTVTAPREQVKPPSLTEELQKLALLKDMFQPKSDGTAEMLKALLDEIRASRTQPTGVAAIANSFKETMELVKTLAPAVNMGTSGGWLKDVITPAVAQTFAAAFGNVASKIMSNAPGVNVQPQASNANAPPPPGPPAAAQPHIAALKVARTEPEQIAATTLVLQAYYSDPAWQPQLEPVAQKLLAGDYEPTRRVIGDMLMAFRKDIASREMAEKIVQAIVTQLRSSGAPVAPEPNAPSQDAQVVQFPKKEEAAVATPTEPPSPAPSEASWVDRAAKPVDAESPATQPEKSA